MRSRAERGIPQNSKHDPEKREAVSLATNAERLRGDHAQYGVDQ
jgi:hypothetical protein